MQRLALVGFMASGKTTVGRGLARLLNIPFIDLDKEIVRVKGRTIPEIFSEFGESVFRKYECEVLKNISQDEKPCVLATGGGTITQEMARSILRQNYYVVYLDIELKKSLMRIEKDGSTRPLANQAQDREDYLKNLLLARRPLYESVASYSCRIQDQSSEEIALTIAIHLEKNSLFHP